MTGEFIACATFLVFVVLFVLWLSVKKLGVKGTFVCIVGSVLILLASAMLGHASFIVIDQWPW